MRSRSRGRIDPGHVIAWFLAGVAVATGAGFVLDLVIRARRRGGEA